jgi:hypothetical protein
MEKLNKIVLIGGAIIIALLLVIALKGSSTSSFGSISNGSAYKSTNIKTITASTTTSTSIKAVPGTVGSLVVASTTGAELTLYDVVNPANFASTTLSTKIITFPSGLAVGTYVLDVSFNRGLAVFSSTTPATEAVITWR